MIKNMYEMLDEIRKHDPLGWQMDCLQKIEDRLRDALFNISAQMEIIHSQITRVQEMQQFLIGMRDEK